jgi:hypothetical protein
MSVQIYNAEILAWSVQEAERIKSGESAPYHAVLCDPPYGIAFMGKEWDDAGGPEAFQVSAKFWGQALKPLLHPGALVFMFAGTRMWHRLAAGMEDAGFHLWDTLMWLHGQGFPKAQDISKLIDKSQGTKREVVGSVKKLQSFGHSGNNCYGGDVDRGGLMKLTSPASEISAPWAGHKTPQGRSRERSLASPAQQNKTGPATPIPRVVRISRSISNRFIFHQGSSESCLSRMSGFFFAASFKGLSGSVEGCRETIGRNPGGSATWMYVIEIG